LAEGAEVAKSKVGEAITAWRKNGAARKVMRSCSLGHICLTMVAVLPLLPEQSDAM